RLLKLQSFLLTFLGCWRNKDFVFTLLLWFFVARSSAGEFAFKCKPIPIPDMGYLQSPIPYLACPASMFGYNRSGVDPFLRTEKKFLNGNKKNLTLKVVGKFTFFPPPHQMRIRFILIMLLVLPSAASLLAQVNQQNRAAQPVHSPRTYAVVA